MISIPETTKAMYKEYDRQLSVYGILYLASKRLSNNLLNQIEYTRLNNCTFSYGVFKQITADSTEPRAVKLQALSSPDVSDLIWEQIKANNVELGITSFKFTKTSNLNYLRYALNGVTIDTGVVYNVSNLTNGEEYYIGATFTNITQGNIEFKKMYINKNNSNYEEYGIMVNDYTEFLLTEENECKILSFNINEKTDVYYTSLPYNTMTIEVDNEKGYFTDYDQDSIVNRLNTDCYVDLFIKINEDDYYKIMTMKFDKISSSDYEKAKLSFKSNISLLKTLPLRDKYNSVFIQRNLYKNILINYMEDNYNIDLICDNTDNVIIADIVEQNTNSVENLLIQAGTRYGDLSNAVLTINDSQDRIVQRTWKAEGQDLITRDMQLEKSIIKREDNYRGVRRKYSASRQWDSNSTETFNLTINGKLSNSSDTIVLRNNLYKINDITTNDITSTGLTSLSVNQNGPYEILIININGNIGTNYEIVINKTNIVKKISDNYVEEVKGNIDDTTKILNITEQAPLLSNYYNLILLERQIKSNIEARIMGLPYLEVGDTIEIETELAKVLMTISEIDMNFDGGLTETIRGYELGWDALYPADDLYPSDYLYPNTPI